jgi:hypothetical protein
MRCSSASSMPPTKAEAPSIRIIARIQPASPQSDDTHSPSHSPERRRSVAVPFPTKRRHPLPIPFSPERRRSVAVPFTEESTPSHCIQLPAKSTKHTKTGKPLLTVPSSSPCPLGFPSASARSTPRPQHWTGAATFGRRPISHQATTPIPHPIPRSGDVQSPSRSQKSPPQATASSCPRKARNTRKPGNPC